MNLNMHEPEDLNTSICKEFYYFQHYTLIIINKNIP